MAAEYGIDGSAHEDGTNENYHEGGNNVTMTPFRLSTNFATYEEPGGNFCLLDSNSKKGRFNFRQS